MQRTLNIIMVKCIFDAMDDRDASGQVALHIIMVKSQISILPNKY